jgi:hypothetical protein
MLKLIDDFIYETYKHEFFYKLKLINKNKAYQTREWTITRKMSVRMKIL